MSPADGDTLVSGRRDFSRYTNPIFCVAAAENALATARRGLGVQVLRDTLAVDTAGLDAAAQVARACLVRFPVTLAAPVPVASRWDEMFELAVFAENDTLAHALLVTHPDGWDQGMALYLKHGRFQAAATLLAEADAKGPSGWRLRLALHDQLRHFYQTENTAASRLQERREDSVMLQQVRQTGVDQQLAFFYLGHVYGDLMRLAVLEDTTQVLPVAQQALTEMHRLFGGGQPLDIRGKPVYRNWAHFTTDSLIRMFTPDWYSALRFGGPAAPPVVADFWWPAPGLSSNTTVPVAGKVNLICGGGNLANHGNSNIAAWMATYVRRWAAKYGSSGLVITVLRAATGGAHYLYQPMLLGRYVTVTDSADEAQFWRWYDQTYHQLPVTVAVAVVHTTQWLPAPDGRRLVVSTSTANPYVNLASQAVSANSKLPSVCTLVSRSGTILSVEGGEDESNNPHWQRLEEALGWLFGQHPTPSPIPGNFVGVGKGGA